MLERAGELFFSPAPVKPKTAARRALAAGPAFSKLVQEKKGARLI